MQLGKASKRQKTATRPPASHDPPDPPSDFSTDSDSHDEELTRAEREYLLESSTAKSFARHMEKDMQVVIKARKAKKSRNKTSQPTEEDEIADLETLVDAE